MTSENPGRNGHVKAGGDGQQNAGNKLDQNGDARDEDSGDELDDRLVQQNLSDDEDDDTSQRKSGTRKNGADIDKNADNGQLQAGGYREQNPGDAKDQNTGSVKQAQNVGSGTQDQNAGAGKMSGSASKRKDGSTNE